MDRPRDHRRDWDAPHHSGRQERREPPPHARGHSRSPPPRRDDRPRYRDRDREGFRSPPRGSSRSRSRSWSPRGREGRDRGRSPHRSQPQHPSRDVMMEALPLDMTEDDIRHELDPYVRGLEDVRIIRDRKSGRSRQFGFLRFAHVDDAAAFLDKNGGSVILYGSNDRRCDVRVQFVREREERQYEADWECPNCSAVNFSRRAECLRCHLAKSDAAAYIQETPQFTNTGDSDASMDSVPSQFLLIRNLEPSVSEEVLAKGITKLYKVGEDPAGNHARKSTSKVISTTSITNYGAPSGSLKRVFVIRDRRTDDSWRYGFAEFHSVEDAQAAFGKFNASDKFTISSKPVLISYIHAGVFVPVLSPTSASEKTSFTATSNPSLKLAYWDEAGYASELMISESPPVAEPVAQETSAAASGEGKSTKDGTKVKKRKAEGAGVESSKKATLSHLQFWSNRHAELHGTEGKDALPAGDTTQAPADPKAEVTEAMSEDAPPRQSYADMDRMCCLLCSRQFKTTAEVNRHERLSQLHQDNLRNDDLKAKAAAKLQRAGIVVPTAEMSEYRDRAKERRNAHRQPKKPTTNKPARPPPPSGTQPEPSKLAEKKSKGASMLGKMGWTAGEGLGAQGTGIAAPIATDAYVQGVGLGAQGGKLGDAADEASRNTKGGYDAFLERTRERAKERFERME